MREWSSGLNALQLSWRSSTVIRDSSAVQETEGDAAITPVSRRSSTTLTSSRTRASATDPGRRGARAERAPRHATSGKS
jgi:hypothetical protein